MIKPSPELIAITRRWSEAIIGKDERTLLNLFSTSEHLCYIGTAFGERWSGDVLRKGFGDHAREIPEATQKELHIEAFECGNVGWSAWICDLKFATMENPVQLRVTMTFALEDGSWKIVQYHASNPTRNIEIIGVEHAALDGLVEAAKEGFHHSQREGTATVMFTDIANSSAIADALGDRVWAPAVQSHFSFVTQVIEANGGQLIKSLGDGTMSTFTSARAALIAAREIQKGNREADTEPQLQLRVGVHTGDVIQTEDDFFGTVVNKAARIAAMAEPDEICVSDATRIMAGKRAGLLLLKPVEVVLKGLSGTHVVHRLNWNED